MPVDILRCQHFNRKIAHCYWLYSPVTLVTPFYFKKILPFISKNIYSYNKLIIWKSLFQINVVVTQLI